MLWFKCIAPKRAESTLGVLPPEADILKKISFCQYLTSFMKCKAWVCHIPTFFYELPPALPPLCELLCVGLFNACPLMKTVHQIITESVAIIYPFHCSLVVTNLGTKETRQIGQQHYGLIVSFNFLQQHCCVADVLRQSCSHSLDLFYLFHQLLLRYDATSTQHCGRIVILDLRAGGVKDFFNSPPRSCHWRHRSWSHHMSLTSLLPWVTLSA